MRYSIEQIDLVIAEYVVGTLHGPARRRVETLMRERADVRSRAWFFERALGASLGNLEPVTPDSRVWQRIAQRTAPHTEQAAPRRNWWQALLIAVPLAAALAFAAILFIPDSNEVRYDRVAVFADAQAQTQWLVQADLRRGRLDVRAQSASPAEAGQVYELWALPEGAAPQSLGLIDVGAAGLQKELDSTVVELLARSTSLAISIEPAGGSPTGAPTGPVIGQAAFVVLK